MTVHPSEQDGRGLPSRLKDALAFQFELPTMTLGLGVMDRILVEKT